MVKRTGLNLWLVWGVRILDVVLTHGHYYVVLRIGRKAFGISRCVNALERTHYILIVVFWYAWGR